MRKRRTRQTESLPGYPGDPAEPRPPLAAAVTRTAGRQQPQLETHAAHHTSDTTRWLPPSAALPPRQTIVFCAPRWLAPVLLLRQVHTVFPTVAFRTWTYLEGPTESRSGTQPSTSGSSFCWTLPTFSPPQMRRDRVLGPSAVPAERISRAGEGTTPKSDHEAGHLLLCNTRRLTKTAEGHQVSRGSTAVFSYTNFNSCQRLNRSLKLLVTISTKRG